MLRHTSKDEEVSWERVREMERKVNSHTIAWNLIWRAGEDHGHQERILKSRATRSGNQARLSLLYKDHKPGNKTRPVASGNESFNLGLSNGISEVMESVAKAIECPYSVISSEDILARITKFNLQESAPRTAREKLETHGPPTGEVATMSPQRRGADIMPPPLQNDTITKLPPLRPPPPKEGLSNSDELGTLSL